MEWLKDFDQRTSAKAAGRHRLLLVDGHNSHYSKAFIDYAIENRIVVLCYPSHNTHLLQGLDVVAFAVLKRAWTLACDLWKEMNHPAKLTKYDFLSVFAQAYEEAMTVENRIKSFSKTGVVPFDPTVIRPEQMAPSIPHSTRGSLPLPLPSPVKRMMKAHHQLMKEGQPRSISPGLDPSQDIHMYDRPAARDGSLSDESGVGDTHNDEGWPRSEDSDDRGEGDRGNLQLDPSLRQPEQDSTTPASTLRSAFESSSARPLVSRSPFRSSTFLPDFPYSRPAPLPPIDWSLSDADSGHPRRTRGELEAENRKLRQDLREAHDKDVETTRSLDAAHAMVALSGMAYSRAQVQLLSQETRKNGEPSERLKNTNGRLVTHEWFQRYATGHERAQVETAEKEAEKSRRNKAWKAAKVEFDAAVVLWKATKTRDGAKKAGRKPAVPTKKAWMEVHFAASSGEGDRSDSEDESCEE